jgi:hypothetical protein
VRPIFLFAVPAALAAALALAQPAAPTRRDATVQEATLLTEALEKTAGDLDHWAYTETQMIHDEKGRVKRTSVVRYDPSRPYEEQWTPVSINGKSPTDADLRKYRQRGEHAARHQDDGKDPRRPSLGELMDLPRSTVVAETAQTLTFDVPLRKENNHRFPPDNFEVLVRIAKASRGVENIAVRLRAAFRAKVIFKIKSGEGTLEFAAIDEKHPPTLTTVQGDASASVLFFSVGGELELKRTELRHVRPFGDRFDVKIGPLKALDF